MKKPFIYIQKAEVLTIDYIKSGLMDQNIWIGLSENDLKACSNEGCNGVFQWETGDHYIHSHWHTLEFNSSSIGCFYLNKDTFDTEHTNDCSSLQLGAVCQSTVTCPAPHMAMVGTYKWARVADVSIDQGVSPNRENLLWYKEASGANFGQLPDGSILACGGDDFSGPAFSDCIRFTNLGPNHATYPSMPLASSRGLFQLYQVGNKIWQIGGLSYLCKISHFI